MPTLLCLEEQFLLGHEVQSILHMWGYIMAHGLARVCDTRNLPVTVGDLFSTRNPPVTIGDLS